MKYSRRCAEIAAAISRRHYDNCLVSQLMLRLISKVTLETKSGFTAKKKTHKKPADVTHRRYLSEAPAIPAPARSPVSGDQRAEAGRGR